MRTEATFITIIICCALIGAASDKSIGRPLVSLATHIGNFYLFICSSVAQIDDLKADLAMMRIETERYRRMMQTTSRPVEESLGVHDKATQEINAYINSAMMRPRPRDLPTDGGRCALAPHLWGRAL